MLIRDATAGDWPQIWQFLRQIVSAGVTYPYDPDTDEATGGSSVRLGAPSSHTPVTSSSPLRGVAWQKSRPATVTLKGDSPSVRARSKHDERDRRPEIRRSTSDIREPRRVDGAPPC